MAEINSVTDTNNETDAQEVIFTIRNDPVMNDALEVVTQLNKTNKIILYAKGNSIPNAVAVANIITEKIQDGKLIIQKITVDSEIPNNMGRMLSSIKIILIKKY